MTVVLDYGMGNLRSVERALTHLGARVCVKDNLVGASKLVIPGVGAFGAAMERLSSLSSEICAFASSSPVLGICLGQQLLFESSEELGEHRGLGLLAGRVHYLPKSTHTKVPHMGWNEVEFVPTSKVGSGFPRGGQVYFVHSLVTSCANPDDVAGVTVHGTPFASAVERGHLWGCQFHPEKSGDLGLRLLSNFLAL